MHAEVKKALAYQPGDFKAVVERAKARGLVHGPGEAPAKLPVAAPIKLDGLTVEFVAIPPELAIQWLRRNIGNRSIRSDAVAAFVRDMRQGNWITTHQGIAFNDRDELIDGQHRLQAIVESGVTVTLLVVRGLASKPISGGVKTMDTVDRGTGRTISDLLALQHGYDPREAKLVAAVGTALARICIFADAHERKIRLRRMTAPLLLSILAEYKDSVLFVIRNRDTTIGLRQTVVLGSIAFAHAVQPAEAAACYSRLITGESLDRTNPVLHLRNYLTSDKFRKLHSHSTELKGSFCTILNAVMQFIQNVKTDNVIDSTAGLAWFADKQLSSVKKIADLFS